MPSILPLVSNILSSGPATGPTATMMMNGGSFASNVGALIGRAITGGSPTGDAIGSLLGQVGGSILSGRANTPVTMANTIVPAVVGTAGRAMMSGAIGEMGAMGMRMLFGGRGMRVPAGVARAIRSLTPQIGLEAAANAVGLSLSDAARVFARRRRQRGISAADVRRTYRVLNFTSRIQSHLGKSRICRKR